MKDQERKTSKFWDYLASRYTYVAPLHDWRWEVGDNIDFEIFQDKYLTPTDEYASSVICAKQCIGCGYRRVIELYRGGYEAVCKKWSNDAFEIDSQEVLEFTVLEDELVADIAKVLEITPYTAELVFCDNSWKIGNITVRGESHSVFFTLQWGPGLLELILQLNRLMHNPYVLLGTSEAVCCDTANGCLADGNAFFVPLNETLDFNQDAEPELISPFSWEKLLLSPEALTEEPENIFRRCGDAWEVRFQGGDKFMLTGADTGARYLHFMLGKPGVSTPITEIMRKVSGESDDYVSVDMLDDGILTEGYSFGELPDAVADNLADDKAIRQYRQEINRLKHDIEAAESIGDNITVEQLEQDLQNLTDKVNRIIGPDGKKRSFANSRKNMLDAMRKTMLLTITKIDQIQPSLAEHLRTSMKYGQVSGYIPGYKIIWEL